MPKESAPLNKKQSDVVSKPLGVIASSTSKKPVKSLSSRFGEYDPAPVKKRKEGKDEVITISIPVNEPQKNRKVPVKEKRPITKGEIMYLYAPK